MNDTLFITALPYTKETAKGISRFNRIVIFNYSIQATANSTFYKIMPFLEVFQIVNCKNNHNKDSHKYKYLYPKHFSFIFLQLSKFLSFKGILELRHLEFPCEKS